MVDSIITAVRPGGPGVSSNLVMSSRCALPPVPLAVGPARAPSPRRVLAARLDNLGKGASGAAVQNLNIALGLDEATGLD